MDWDCARTGSAPSLSLMERDEGNEIVGFEVDLVFNNILGEGKAPDRCILFQSIDERRRSIN